MTYFCPQVNYNMIERMMNMKAIYLMIGIVSTLPIQVNAGEMVATEMYCSTTKELVKELREKYKEAPVLVGKTADEAESIMTLWTNPDTKSWTIIATKGDVSCLVGSGEKFNMLSKGPRV